MFLLRDEKEYETMLQLIKVGALFFYNKII